jgi:hypothetical protein
MCTVAPSGLDRNTRNAKRASFRRRFSRLLSTLQSIHLANEHEDRKGDDQEIEKSIDEQTIVESGAPAALASARRGIRTRGQINKLARKV